MAEAQEGLGRAIVFLPIGRHRNKLVASMAQGFRDSSESEERIWLDATLPRLAGEATAAHELGHVVQRKESYPHILSVRGGDGRPFFASLMRLAARTNNLVLDESADRWAIARGFNLGYALRRLTQNGVIDSLKGASTAPEASNWKRYYADLDRLASLLKNQKTFEHREIGPEADTQALALDYAGLSLRLGRYGLFAGLDEIWQKQWPISRKTGRELAALVKDGTFDSSRGCRKALQTILDFLKIPQPLLELND